MASAVTTGSGGLEARVCTELHVCRGESARIPSPPQKNRSAEQRQLQLGVRTEKENTNQLSHKSVSSIRCNGCTKGEIVTLGC